MSGRGGLTLVVDDATDALARQVAAELARRGRQVEHVPALRLGMLDVHLAGRSATVNGRRLGAVLFRAAPWSRYDAGFTDTDASFATAEVAATWLAITQLPSVISLNRLHPEAWSTFSEWPVWRRCLAAAGVPQVEIGVGDLEEIEPTWLPWGGGVATAPRAAIRRSFAPALTRATGLRHGLWFDGTLLDGSGSPAAEQGAASLAADGIRLAGISIDRSGRVAAATAHPRVADATAAAVAGQVADALAS